MEDLLNAQKKKKTVAGTAIQGADEESARVLQSIVRGIIARKEISRLRLEEMEFLGMMRPVKTIEEQNNPLNPIKLK